MVAVKHTKHIFPSLQQYFGEMSNSLFALCSQRRETQILENLYLVSFWVDVVFIDSDVPQKKSGSCWKRQKAKFTINPVWILTSNNY